MFAMRGLWKHGIWTACLLSGCVVGGGDGDGGVVASRGTDGGMQGGPVQDSGLRADAGGPAEVDAALPDDTLVPVTLRGEALFTNGYPRQIDGFLQPFFGDAMRRVRLFARFCADPACSEVRAVVEAPFERQDDEGFWVLSTAAPNGSGFGNPFTISEAPAGRSYLQLVGDTAVSIAVGKGACDIDTCPGDADVLQIEPVRIESNNGAFSRSPNPPPTSIEVEVTAGGTIELPGTQYLGHLVFDEAPLRRPIASPRPDRFLVALEDAASGFVHRMTRMVIDSEGLPQNEGAGEILTVDGLPVPGDVCGIVRGDEGLFAIVRGAPGVWILALDFEGRATSEGPVAFLPNPEERQPPPAPCRGEFARIDGRPFLYLNEYAGAGSREDSWPYPIVVVDLEAGTFTTPYTERFGPSALRGLVVDVAHRIVVVSEMSWSAQPNNIGTMVTAIQIGPDGQLGELERVIHMGRPSDDTCGATNNWPGALTRLTIGGVDRLVMGHDEGVTVFELPSLQPMTDLDLRAHGRLFRQIAVSPDGTRAYAVPQCKARIEDGHFTLPTQADDRVATDRTLAVELDLTGPELRVAETTIDIDTDGTPDPGIDLEYYFLKHYLRTFNPGMPLPPVLLVAPQVAVGESSMILRGSGAGASGLGQAQDLTFFDRATGHGLLLNGYVPWWHGLSGVWGFDFVPGEESSVGFVEYLP